MNRKAPKKEGDMMITGDYYGDYLLPQLGFGSWLKENASGLLKGAGSLAKLIPGVGQIAGPILNIAGSIIGKNQQDKAARAEQQKLIAEKEAADKKNKFNMELANRKQSLFGGAEQGINYGETFAFGGDMMGGMMMENQMKQQQPQITEYSDKADLHEEGIGGVPVDARGNPATVSKTSAVGLTEGGEVTWNGYVFSNRLKFR